MKTFSLKNKQSLRTMTLLMVFVLLILFFWKYSLPSSLATSSSLNPYEPGTNEYYNYEFEKSKMRAGWLYKLGLKCMDSNGEFTKTKTQGPWNLDLDYTEESGDGKCSLPWDGTTVTDEEFEALEDVDIYQNNGRMVTVKRVFTAQEYRYAVANRCSFQLQNDIDLGGYLHTSTSSRSWVTPDIGSETWIVDGGGHTVHNFYLASSEANQSMFGQADHLTIQNLRVSNAYVTSQGDKPYALAVFLTNAYDINIFNCGTENTVVYLESKGEHSAAIYACNIDNLKIDNCYTRNTHLVVFSGGKNSCSAHMALGGQTNTITNSYAIDGTVIGNKGHNGGFASCLSYLDNNIQNCFANIDVYGNKDAGVFIGVQHDGTHTIENCYATGKVEGTDRLGGFIGSVEVARDENEDVEKRKNLNSTIKQCYSASMVGMMSNATNQGSFIGSPQSINGNPGQSIKFNLIDCYAVGEVGSLDVDVSDSRSTDYKTIGGFLGEYSIDGDRTKTALLGCYYDKQTTAMREWAMGTDSTTSVGYRSDDTESMGVKGVLTTDTEKSGSGMTSNPSDHKLHCNATNHKGCFTGFEDNSQWVFHTDHYPQLKKFAEPGTEDFKNTNWLKKDELLDLIKAYSQASVSTPKLQTYDKNYAGNTLPKETYDTVRDLTLDFYLSSKPNSFWDRDEAATKLFDETSVDVLKLIDNGNGSGKWLADITAPGIEWVTVQCTIEGQVGSKRLRIIPTASLDGGKDKKLKYGETYDHADDVRLAYSIGARLDEAFENWGEMGYGVTTGVFPDKPLNDVQKKAQIPEGNLSHHPPGSNPPLTGKRLADFENQNDLFDGVDASHLSKDLSDNANESKLYVSVYEIESISEAGEIIPGAKIPVDNCKSDNPDNDLFNGISPFDAGLGTQYLVKYIWELSDGRYLEKSKVITSSFKPPEVLKTASVNGEEPEIGTGDDPVPVNKGDEIEYIITVHNYESRDSKTNVIITDILPKGLKYLNSSNDGIHTVEMENNRDVVTWNISEFPPNTTKTFTVKAEVIDYGLFTNQAIATLEDYGDIKTNETYHKASGKGIFSFKKIDAATGEALAGAEFNLYLWEGEGDAPGELIPKELSGSGWTYIETRESEAETGLVDFTALIPGEYRLVETKAPDEYQLPMGQWRFEITQEEKVNLLPSVGKNKPPDFKGAGTVEESYLLENVPKIKVAFHFIKVDVSTNKPLWGAQFKLYLWEGEEEAPEELVPEDLTDSDWIHIDTQVSAFETGRVQLESLQPGKYQLAETKAPTGYQLPFGQWRFEITDDGEINILSGVGEYMLPAIKGEGTDEAPYLIGNVVKYKLPEVGGGGILRFTVIGILLLATGLLLTVIKLNPGWHKAGKVL